MTTTTPLVILGEEPCTFFRILGLNRHPVFPSPLPSAARLTHLLFESTRTSVNHVVAQSHVTALNRDCSKNGRSELVFVFVHFVLCSSVFIQLCLYWCIWLMWVFSLIVWFSLLRTAFSRIEATETGIGAWWPPQWDHTSGSQMWFMTYIICKTILRFQRSRNCAASTAVCQRVDLKNRVSDFR